MMTCALVHESLPLVETSILLAETSSSQCIFVVQRDDSVLMTFAGNW